MFISLVIIAIQIANCIVLSQKIGQKEYKLSKEYRDSSPFNIILPPSLQMKNQNIISLNVSSLKYYDKPFNDTMFFIYDYLIKEQTISYSNEFNMTIQNLIKKNY